MNDDKSQLSIDSVGQAPFSEPADSGQIPNLLHPRYDSEIDLHEAYDEGLASAAGAEDFHDSSVREFDLDENYDEELEYFE